MLDTGFAADVAFTPWWWEAAPLRAAREVALPAAADVVVIGSGYTGLAAALELARAGREVVVLEANAPGHGASTRNGGQVGSGNQKLPVAQLVRRLGEGGARALLAEGAAMLRHLAELIERERIDCHFARVGRFRAAICPAHYDAMARDLEAQRRLVRVEYSMLSRSEQHTEVGTEAYHGGALLPGDAALHPALFHRGLLERTESAGARVVSHTRAAAVAGERGAFRVRTARGAISARDVLVATNGYADAAVPALARRVVPIGSGIVATGELAPELVSRLIPKGRIVSNTARVLHYYRTSPDGQRILFGGRLHHARAPEGTRAFLPLRREMIALFPELSDVPITHCWSGNVAYTRDALPHLGVRDGIHYATGYCGTGVARAVYFGHKIALKLLGRPDGASAFDALPFRAFPFHAAARRAVPLGVAWKRLYDWLDRRV